MRAVVTGGAGFLGSHLVDRLIKDGWDVVVIDDFSTHEVQPKIDFTWVNPRVIYGSVQEIEIVEKYDAIFHVSGKLGPVGVLTFSGDIATDTINSADHASRWAIASKCPMIDISTSEVYGSPDAANSESTPSVFRPPTSARKEYAVSKLTAETMLLNRPSLDVRIVRPFNISGSRQRPEGGFVLPRFAKQALMGLPLTVYAPGTQRRSFTSVHDIVDGIMLAYSNGKKGEVYNLGSDRNTCSVTQLALEIIAYVGSGEIEVVDPTLLHGPQFREAPEKIPNADKAKLELGWRPMRTRDHIITEVVEYWRDKL